MARHEQPPVGPAAATADRLAAAVPVLTTARLTLRAPRCGDFPAWAAIVCGPRGAHIGGPMTRDEAWADFVQLASGWMLHGHGGWTVTRTGQDAALGFVLLGLEPGDQEPELGFFLTEEAEGQGFGQEAAAAARTFALDRLRLPSLVSYVARDNARSVRLAERLGGRRDARAEIALNDPDLLVFRHAPTRGTLQ